MYGRITEEDHSIIGYLKETRLERDRWRMQAEYLRKSYDKLKHESAEYLRNSLDKLKHENAELQETIGCCRREREELRDLTFKQREQMTKLLSSNMEIASELHNLKHETKPKPEPKYNGPERRVNCKYNRRIKVDPKPNGEVELFMNALNGSGIRNYEVGSIRSTGAFIMHPDRYGVGLSIYTIEEMSGMQKRYKRERSRITWGS